MEPAGRKLNLATEIVFTVLLGLFFTLIGFGYHTSLATTFPQWPEFSTLLLSVGGIIAVFLCVRLTGAEWNNWQNTGFFNRILIVLLFIPLFFFSAFGVITAAMLLYEGPIICRELMIEMNQAFSKLEASASARLRVPEIENIESAVAILRTSLSKEITNAEGGNFCGIGPSARDTLTKLEALLPNFHRPLAPGQPQHDCRKTEELRALVTQYQGLIDDALEHLPLRAQTRQREKSALNQELKAAADEQIANLQGGVARLVGVTSFAFNLNLYRDSVATLEKADEVYVNLYQRLAGLVGKSNIDAPTAVNIKLAENIAAPTQVFESIFYRLDKWATWKYILFALGCDLAASTIAFLVIRETRRVRAIPVVVFEKKIAGTDVNYLWRPLTVVNARDGGRS